VTAWSTSFARWKLTPSIAVVSAVALFLSGVLVAVYQEQIYRTQKIEDIRAQGQILAASVTAAIVFNDSRAAQEYVLAMQANPELEAVGVYDMAGTRIAGFARAGSGELPSGVRVGAPYVSANRVFVTAPVRQDQSQIGTVFLRANLESFGRRLVRYAGLILLVTMGVLVLVVLGTAHRALTNANTELARQAHDLAESNRKLQTEIEEREKAEEALRQSQKMEAIGQLSGGIAHDFNNLMTIIKGNIQLVQRRLAQGRTDVQRHFDAASEALNRAASLTQRILAFSRQQPLSPKPVNLSDLVLGMHDLLRHSIGDSVTIETSLGRDCWTLCDTNQMENVILNLAINARDAMPSGGKLIIETADIHAHARGDIPPGDYVRLSVRDTGTGMTDEVRQRAIDPFFTTKPQGRGTGLGLSMTFGYVRQSNGYLDIDSALGKGTTITILMPRHAAKTEQRRA
jgi:signal transduction histidine kinase